MGSAITAAISPIEVHETTVLGVCASLKPAPGIDRKSATRGLLQYSLASLASVYPDVSMLDLRDHVPPQFDGRLPSEHPDETLTFLLGCIERAGALLFAIPAYWSGVSGVFKNFIDVLCGPVYDKRPDSKTVFCGKLVGVIVVGADELSARLGAEQSQRIFESCGATLVAPPVVFENLANEHLARSNVALLPGLAAMLARALHAEIHADTF